MTEKEKRMSVSMGLMPDNKPILYCEACKQDHNNMTAWCDRSELEIKYDQLKEENEKLRAERDEYRAALEKVKEIEKPCYDNDPLGFGIVTPSYKVAREVLAKYQKGE